MAIGAIISKILGGGIVAPIAGAFNKYQERKQSIKDAEHEVNMAILSNKARLALDSQTHNSSMEMKKLEVAKPWMRQVVALHVLVLVDVAVFFPEKAVEVFGALKAMPDWCVGLFVTVFGFYFAVNKLSEYGGELVRTWRVKGKETNDKI